MNKHYVKTYYCDPKNMCYCGSNKRFGLCCGIKSQDRDPPKGIGIISDFFEPAALRELAKELRKLPKTPLGTMDPNASDPKNIVIRRDSARVTDTINTDPQTQATLNHMVCSAIKKKIQPLTTDILTHIETPHVLYYKKGGKYDKHTDSEQFDPTRNQFYQVKDRHFSFLIYLNDGYEGGNLKFNFLNYVYRPKAGQAVFFPSGHIFSHQSTPIRRGHKMAIATWGIIEKGIRIGTPVTAATHIKL